MRATRSRLTRLLTAGLAFTLTVAAAAGQGSAATKEAVTTAAVTSTGLRVVERQVLAVPGLQGKEPGPRLITARFPEPTHRGDLLLAGVDDGVEMSGMTHPSYLFPEWQRAVTTIGGQTADETERDPDTGGLKAAIYFLPDNPGGMSVVRVAAVPKHTLAWVTVVLVEVSGVQGRLSVDTTGTSTSGPSPTDYSLVSTVRTQSATKRPGDLALAVFNNGGNAIYGEQFVNSPGWTVLGSDNGYGNNVQPILFDYRIVRSRAVVSETDHYLGGTPIDNCAVIAALE